MQHVLAIIKNQASELFDEIRLIRRHIHQNPELSFQETKTAAFIREYLDRHSISYQHGIAGNGILAEIKGEKKSEKVILLRGDMDALPIQEKTGKDYASINNGIMHACGHDVHTACVLGAAIILHSLKKEFGGTVKIMFQPGEELLPGGASLMIKEGVLKNPNVTGALAQHVYPEMECGKVGFKPGMYMASTDELYVTIQGKGGHAAMPDKYINPLVIASQFVLSAQKEFMENNSKSWQKVPTVLAFGKIEGKGATNVIPDTVEIAGTLRTMNEEHRDKIHLRLQEIITELNTHYNTSSVLQIKKGYPFLTNDESLTQRCMMYAKQYVGEENVEELPLRMTAEDFAYITQEVPSCFYRLGTGNKVLGITSGVHTATFDIDENALVTGTGLMAWLAINELAY